MNLSILDTSRSFATGRQVESKFMSDTVQTNLRPVGDLTTEELSAFDGSDSSKPLLVAIKGIVYDVTAGASFYGPGGPYHVLAGNDASRSLALMSTKKEDVSPSLDGLTEKQKDTLAKWELKFKDKYPEVGKVVTWQYSQV